MIFFGDLHQKFFEYHFSQCFSEKIKKSLYCELGRKIQNPSIKIFRSFHPPTLTLYHTFFLFVNTFSKKFFKFIYEIFLWIWDYLWKFLISRLKKIKRGDIGTSECEWPLRGVRGTDERPPVGRLSVAKSNRKKKNKDLREKIGWNRGKMKENK